MSISQIQMTTHSIRRPLVSNDTSITLLLSHIHYTGAFTSVHSLCQAPVSETSTNRTLEHWQTLSPNIAHIVSSYISIVKSSKPCVTCAPVSWHGSNADMHGMLGVPLV
ncbi:hypothetical protein ABBQ38_009567 [Trebouxia sp. C0009 RCD-2024]